MLSRIRRNNLFLWLQGRAKYLRISTKITCMYALILALLLTVIDIITIAGMHFILYHQAEREIQFSIEKTKEKLAAGIPFTPEFWRDEPVLAGVVLRITDEYGNTILENDAGFPPLNKVLPHISHDPPIWANTSMQVIETANASLYYALVHVARNGRSYDMHFFKIITLENRFIDKLELWLFIVNILGFFAALAAGYFLSNRTLQPIREITGTARRIEVEQMDRRIEVPPSKDEVNELAVTFNHMLDRLQAGFELQRRFVSDASHELRTPVTVILGYSDLLSRWGREDKAVLDEGIASIQSEAENMQQLIEKLLFLARADQQRQALKKEVTEVSGLLEDLIKKTQLVAKEHTVSLLENAHGRVYADPVMLRQMLRIFIDNSIKYTPAGGKITAESKREGNRIHLVLADNGIGIPKEDQEKVFERFYRVDSSRTKADGGVGGTGLGLSIAQWIAQQHDIAITLESELGQGTKIHLEIPLYENDSSV